MNSRQTSKNRRVYVPVAPPIPSESLLKNAALEKENIMLKREVEDLEKSSTSEKKALHLTKLFSELKQDLTSALSDTIKQEFHKTEANITNSAHKETGTDSSLNDTNLCMGEEDVDSDNIEIVIDDHMNTKQK